MSSRGGSRQGARSGGNAGTRVAYVGVGSDEGGVGTRRASGAAVDGASRAGIVTTGSGERRGGDSGRSGNAGTGMTQGGLGCDEGHGIRRWARGTAVDGAPWLGVAVGGGGRSGIRARNGRGGWATQPELVIVVGRAFPGLEHVGVIEATVGEVETDACSP
jgi:hypothetical protein